MNNLNHRSTADRADCQVLVVGAGPTGLTLACELLARGIRTRIIDRNDGAVLETRAGGMHARTLETFEAMGLVDRFLDRGHPVRYFTFYTHGKRLARLDVSRNGSRYGFMLSIPQHETELILRARVVELGGHVEQQSELVSFIEQPDGVIATVREASGAATTIRADFLAGCDGAHSRVRHQLELPFSGHPYPQDWLLADVLLDWQRSEESVHAFFRTGSNAMIAFPMREHRWRIVLPFTGERGESPPTMEEIQRLIDERCPEPVRASDPTWLANFRCHRRSTNRYRVGRVLLAGDAVHIHTPAGGQGMNTGIMDAHNLGWKLALVASGRAEDWLLDTYGAERGPVAHQVLQLTHALVSVGSLSSPGKRLLRNLLAPVAAHLPFVQRRAARRLGHIHVAYPASRLTIADSIRRGPKPGERVPGLPELEERRHVLLVPGRGSLPPSLEAYADLLSVACRDRGPLALVRPDGYMAAHGLPNVEAYFRQLTRVDATEPFFLPIAQPILAG
jgi:2-polyprenyl-6-methoxyphenol hydroxylase-like FAD-dependent oxidoreductase